MSELSNLESLRLLILDVDGVLTDGHTWQDANGVSRRYFSVRDTMGIRSLKKAGVQIAVLCSTMCEEIRGHLEFVGVDAIIDGSERNQAIAELQKRFQLERENIGYMSADANVAENTVLIKNGVGFLFTVEPASKPLKAVAHFTSARAGGDGAVLEVCNLIRNYKQQEFETNSKMNDRAVGL
jgi:3-deoxy-D-manno-octulosonate 8-phosphate phosphatase (KDO 8-P phosphatase)